jgi:hypothetical protein
VTVSKQFTVQVQQGPGIQLELGAASLSMVHTGSSSVTLSIIPQGGVGASGSLSIFGLPIGVTPALSNVSLGASGTLSATLTFNGSAQAKAGTSTVTLTATSTGSGANAGTYSATQSLSLTLK